VSAILAIALGSAAVPVSHSLSEDQATSLVFKAVRQGYPRESLQCFSLLTEERSRTSFDIAVYEKHDRRCGGDPEVMHVRARFRVGRSPVSLRIYDPINDAYRPCRLSKAMLPRCPRP
jgi:hypothetical protein